jgi:hypothetical protein
LGYSAVAAGIEPPNGESINALWLMLSNVASLIGAAAVGYYAMWSRAAAVMPAILSWAATSILFMVALQSATDHTPLLGHLAQR